MDDHCNSATNSTEIKNKLLSLFLQQTYSITVKINKYDSYVLKHSLIQKDNIKLKKTTEGKNNKVYIYCFMYTHICIHTYGFKQGSESYQLQDIVLFLVEEENERVLTESVIFFIS